MTEEQIQRVAIAICRADRRDPYRLEPGNSPYGDDREVVDQVFRGEPHFYVWREYEERAIAAIKAFSESE